MTKWQPIETAPKDGTKILLYSKTLPYYTNHMAVGFWNEIPNSEYYVGWASGMSRGFVDADEEITQVTHWMPLPNPPKEKTDV